MKPTATIDQRPAVASTLRPEIQALRALAVVAVVLYHLWPIRVPGGYIGVDVFFAISGFLILGHLMREINSTGTVRLGRFWARRARRLLPASLVVLAVTGIAVAIVAPTALWNQFFSEIAASATYWVNWMLAANSVDYLGADNGASPVQHFWSLSVEEQLYVAWPILLVALTLAARRLTRVAAGKFLLLALVAVTAASFSYSVIGVATNPSPQYFSTFGRAWEFGAGGILAFLLTGATQIRPQVRAVVSWLGLAMLAGCVFFYSASTSFPGAGALIPVIGTLLVIWAGSPAVRWSPTRLMGIRPIQWIGNLSYSFYLWHWPPIVLAQILTGGELSTSVRILILVGSLILAWLTKRYVEDRARNARALITRPTWVSIASLGAASLLVVAGAGAGMLKLFIDSANTANAIETALNSGCAGAESVAPGADCPDPFAVTVLTDPGFAASDLGRGVLQGDPCKQSFEDSDIVTCKFGDISAPSTTLALIGDSHAAQYIEALDRYGKDHNLRIVTYLKTFCSATGVDNVASPGDVPEASITSCAKWGRDVAATVAADPEISAVIFSNYTQAYEVRQNDSRRALTAAEYSSGWQVEINAGKPVIVIRDLPNYPLQAVPECVAAHMEKYDPCSDDRSTALDSASPMVASAESTPGVSMIDLSDVFCDSDRCHTVIGGLVVYFDSHHITSSFSKTLSKRLGAELEAHVTRSN